MFAFPDSGRSDRQILGEIKVRFRPEAEVRRRSQLSLAESIWDANKRCLANLQLPN
jgi:hypothetical protein